MSVIRRARTEANRFTVARKGYDPGEVEIYIDATADKLAELANNLAVARQRIRALEAEVQAFREREDDFTRPVRLSYSTGEAIVAEAEREAVARIALAEETVARLLADGRAQLARETAELDSFRLAIAAEAATLAEAEQRLSGRVSRAAAALAQIVDGQGGLGPFSVATGSLLEFAKLLLAAVGSGALGEVRVALEGDVASATVIAARAGAPTEATPIADLRTEDLAPEAAEAGEAGAGRVPPIVGPAREGLPRAEGAAGGDAPRGPVSETGGHTTLVLR